MDEKREMEERIWGWRQVCRRRKGMVSKDKEEKRHGGGKKGGYIKKLVMKMVIKKEYVK